MSSNTFEDKNRSNDLRDPSNALNNKSIEITMEIKIEKNDINKEIYFLDNALGVDSEGVNHNHDNIKEVN